ncbi:MAG: copper resistance CopC family protein [Spartobacteria bacterium]
MNRFLAAFLSLILFAGSALAHSALERTEPKADETLKVAPNEVRFWFSEPIKVGLSTFILHDASGKQVDQRDLRADEKEPGLVRLSLPPGLPAGVYKVTWSAVAQDLHVGKGGFSFTVAP